MRYLGTAIVLVALAAVAGCGGGGDDKSSSTTTKSTTTTTSPFIRPSDCINGMQATFDVWAAQSAIDDNNIDLDNALTDVANAVDDDAAKRKEAQARVDLLTLGDPALRSELTAAQTRFDSLVASCSKALGSSKYLTAGCQGVLEEARAITAEVQDVLATSDQLVGLGRQIVTHYVNGNYEAGNDVVDQHNDVADAYGTKSEAVGPKMEGYEQRVATCTD